MLPDGFEQLELFKTSPTGELIPAVDLSDDSENENEEEKKWQDDVIAITRKNQTDC